MARPKKIISSADLDAATPPEMREDGIDASDIQIVPAHAMRSKAAEAKFMDEKVVIHIEAGDGENEAVFVHSGHQGITQYVERGKDQTVKRKYLYSLLAANICKFASAFGKDQSGNEFNRFTPNGQRTHRVSLVSDRNPEGGMKWVREISKSLARTGLTVDEART